MNLQRVAVACALALGLGACATTPPLQHESLAPAADDTPAARELTEVPFHPQDAYQCGPAALATLMNVTGVDTDAAALRDAVYIPGRSGSLQPELLGASRREGLVPYVLAPRFEDLLAEIAAGHPVLVLQNLGLDILPVWHYAVVIGFDREARQVILRSGTTRREVLSFDRFERTWRSGDYWAMTLHRPDRLPATVEAGRYLEAVAGLEQPAPAAAARAYRTAAARWPDAWVPHFGLGNLAYGRGDHADAEAHYRRALARASGEPAVHHNLAWALLRQGRDEAGLAHARRAADLAEPGESHYRSALEAALARARQNGHGPRGQ